MENWKMVLAHLEHMVQTKSVERIEWYEKSKEVK